MGMHVLVIVQLVISLNLLDVKPVRFDALHVTQTSTIVLNVEEIVQIFQCVIASLATLMMVLQIFVNNVLIPV
jgi:hypothetical protein